MSTEPKHLIGRVEFKQALALHGVVDDDGNIIIGYNHDTQDRIDNAWRDLMEQAQERLQAIERERDEARHLAEQAVELLADNGFAVNGLPWDDEDEDKEATMSKDVECPYCGKWQEINHESAQAARAGGGS